MNNFSKLIGDRSFEELMELFPEGIVLVDSRGKIISVNGQASKMFEYAKEELVGQKVEILVPEKYRHSHVEVRGDFHQRPSKKLMGNRKELVGRKKDGTTFPVEISIGPIDNNGATNSIAIIRDTSQRKYIKQLEFKNNELEQFAFIASHDLQEPLRAIVGLVEITQMQFQGQVDDTLDKNLQYMSDAAKRMSRLINGLLDYARIGNKEGLKKIDLNVCLKDILTDLSVSIEESGANIQIDNLPVIKGYEVEIRLLFQNLISNAIKFRQPGLSPEISITSRKVENFWEFSISDNGIGIAPENLQKIFVIFQRLHLQKQYDGAGIGLAHCKKIVELHGGEIWVESELYKGSKFVFTIMD